MVEVITKLCKHGKVAYLSCASKLFQTTPLSGVRAEECQGSKQELRYVCLMQAALRSLRAGIPRPTAGPTPDSRPVGLRARSAYGIK